MPESAPDAAEQSPGVECTTRRVVPRFACRHVTFYRPVANRRKEAELATVHDVSLSGIGLLIRYRIEPGTILAIELNSTIHTVRHQRLARVTHATEHANGYVLLGCEFASRLSEAELASLTR